MRQDTMTHEQYRAYLANPKKKAKYRSITSEVDGHKFHSRKEAKRYGELTILQLAGEITDLELQPEFQIRMEGKKIAKYFADFRYKKNGETIIEDVKGFKNSLYKLKKRLVEIQYCIEIIET